MIAPAECPCGHPLGDLYMCIRSRPEIYGPCPDENCGGVCEYYGDCTSPDCACKRIEEEP